MPYPLQERPIPPSGLHGASTSFPAVVQVMGGANTVLADVVESVTYQYDSGVAKGTQTATTLQDTDKAWTTNDLSTRGATLTIHVEEGGVYAVESQAVASNTANTITVGSAWANNPVNGSTHYTLTVAGHALLVKGAEIDIDAEEINITDIKGGHYKSSPPDLANNDDTQFLTDVKGRIVAVGAAADGSAVAGAPVRMGAKDGSGNTQDIESTVYGIPYVIDLPIHTAAETFTWNSDGTLNTYAIAINGNTYTITYTWNSDGTLASTATVVT